MNDTLHAQPSGEVLVTIANPTHGSRGGAHDVMECPARVLPSHSIAAIFIRYTNQP